MLNPVENRVKVYTSNPSIIERPKPARKPRPATIIDELAPEPEYQLSEVEKEFKPENIYYFDDIMKNVLCARNKGWNAFCPRCEKDTLIAIEKILKKIS